MLINLSNYNFSLIKWRNYDGHNNLISNKISPSAASFAIN